MSISMNRAILQNLLKRSGRFANKSQISSFRQVVNRNYLSAANFNALRPSALSGFDPSAQIRAFSDNKPDEDKKEQSEEENNAESNSSEGEEDETEISEVEKLENQLKEMKDQLLRSLAEQENIRRIAKKDIENARNFAVSSFAKSLLDTSDNLSRALEAVPDEFRSDSEKHPVLATLYEGIQMTDDGLSKAFAKNGLKKFGAPGDKFDPNMHEALFEYPDENMEAGSIGQVMKVGFSLNDRVIRPAEVGITKVP